MALSDILEKIQADSGKKTELFKKESEVVLKSFKTAAEAEERRVMEEADRQLKKIILEQEQKVISAANLSARLEEAAAKREVIDLIFKEALDRLCDLDNEQYSKLLERLFKKAPKFKSAEVYAPKARLAVTKEACKKSSLPYSVSARENIKGGFIIETDGVIYNADLAEIVENIRLEEEPNIGNLIFGNYEN